MVVVVLGVVVVVVGVAATDDTGADVGSVVVVVAGSGVVDVVEGADVESIVVVPVDEWAVPLEATTKPSPMAPAEAATAIPVVARRTRARARSRDRGAARGMVVRCLRPDAMGRPFGVSWAPCRGSSGPLVDGAI